MTSLQHQHVVLDCRHAFLPPSLSAYYGCPNTNFAPRLAAVSAGKQDAFLVPSLLHNMRIAVALTHVSVGLSQSQPRCWNA